METRIENVKEMIEAQLNDWDNIKPNADVDEMHPIIAAIQKSLLVHLNNVNHKLHGRNP